MPAHFPWSLKGVSMEARQAARVASQARGMTVGAWMSEVIRATAAEESAAAQGAAAAIADLRTAAQARLASEHGEDTTELLAQIALLEARVAAAEASLHVKRARRAAAEAREAGQEPPTPAAPARE